MPCHPLCLDPTLVLARVGPWGETPLAEQQERGWLGFSDTAFADVAARDGLVSDHHEAKPSHRWPGHRFRALEFFPRSHLGIRWKPATLPPHKWGGSSFSCGFTCTLNHQFRFTLPKNRNLFQIQRAKPKMQIMTATKTYHTSKAMGHDAASQKGGDLLPHHRGYPYSSPLLHHPQHNRVKDQNSA